MNNIVFRGTEARLIDLAPGTFRKHRPKGKPCAWSTISEVKPGARPLKDRQQNLNCNELLELEKAMQLWDTECVTDTFK